MGDVASWAKRAVEQEKFAARNSLFNKAQITHTVSKSFSGDTRQDEVFTECERPEASRHLHYSGSFDCPSLVSMDCDSKFSQKFLNGRLDAAFKATFGHDNLFDKKALHLNRGYFNGNFDLINGKGKKFLNGHMNGLCNIGLNRRPFEKVFEECHHVGRWYGRVEATVELDRDELAYLTASLALEIHYRQTSSWLEMKYIGNLEGLLIRQCTHAA